MNMQDWFPLSLTGLISLLSNRLSRVFANSLSIKQIQGPSDPPQGLCVKFWAKSFELFWGNWNPYRVEEVNCMCTWTLDLRLCVLVAQLCWTPFNPMDCSHQAPLSMEFSRQEYWNGLPFSSPRDLHDPGIKPGSPAFQVAALPSPLLMKPQYTDWMETKSWLCWLLITSPPTNQKNVHKLITHPTTPFPHLIFKTFSSKPSGNSRLLSPGCMGYLLGALW